MVQRPIRSGKAGGVIVVCLFLLCTLLSFPILYQKYRYKAKAKIPEQYRFADIDESALEIRDWHYVPDLETEIAQFQTVFWEPDDTSTLREWLKEHRPQQSDSLLEIGTGTGLVSLYCLKLGAGSVTATDINPNAYANSIYNADHLGLIERFEARLVKPENPGPYSTIDAGSKFDLIISNPPWEDAKVEELAAYALYDEGFQLLDAMLEESAAHLKENGKLLLAYGAKAAITRILENAPKKGWEVEYADERNMDDLPEVFVPAVLLVLSPISPQ